MSLIDLEKFNFSSPIYREILDDLKKTSQLPVPLHIMGLSGTGKSTWAHWISKNYRNPKVIDLQNQNIDQKIFEEITQNFQCDFILLEHVDCLTLQNQKILLDWIDKEAYRKKIVSTARGNLFAMVQKNLFRSDLYYKLTVLQVHLPGLDVAREEVSAIAQFYLRVYEILYNKSHLRISDQAVRKLMNHDWTDHIRELDQIIERAVVISASPEISENEIQFIRPISATNTLKQGVTLSEMERQLILQTLQMTEQNRTQAAQILGISIRTLRNKLNEYKEEGLL